MKHIKNIYLFLNLCLLFKVSIVCSQNTLTGTIINQQSKEALPGVLVFFPDLKSGVISNINGYYQINNLPAIKTIVQLKLLGYKTIAKQIDLDKIQELNFEMEESVVEAEEIVVTGGSHASELKRNPIPVISINNKFLSQSVSNNVIEAIAKVPGLSSLNTGPNVSKPFIRGLGYNRILTLFDGIRQDGQQWGDEHGIEVDQFLIDRIEVIKGPASLIYGSDALAGVINLLPAHAASQGYISGGFITSYQTNNKQIASSLNIDGNTKGFVWGIRGSQKMASTYKNSYDGNVYGTKYNEKDLNAYAGITKSWGFSHLHFSMYDNSQEIPDGSRDSITRKFTKKNSEADTLRPIVSDKELNSYTIGAVHQKINHYRMYSNSNFFFGRSKLGIKTGFQQSRRAEFGDPLYPSKTGLNLLLNTVSYDVKYYFPEWKKTETTIGLNGMYQRNINHHAHEFVIPDYSSFDIGPFALIKKTFNKIDLVAGIRYDQRMIKTDALYTEKLSGEKIVKVDAPLDTTIVKQFDAYSSSFSGISGSIGSTFVFNDKINIKINIARGYRAPNISEISAKGVHPGTGFQQLGDVNFKPEFSLQEDIGLFYTNEHISGSIELFNNNISNYIYNEKLLNKNGGDSIYTEGGNNYQVFKFKQTKAQLYGAEFSLDIHPHPLDWLHFENTASIIYGINRGGNGVRITDSTRNLPLITPVHTNSELRADFKKKIGPFTALFFKVGFQYYAPQNLIYSAYSTETKTAGYSLIDAGLGTDVVSNKGNKLFTISIHAGNLLDKAYQSNMSRLKYFDNYPNNPSGRSGIYNMGRNISCKLTIPLDVKTGK